MKKTTMVLFSVLMVACFNIIANADTMPVKDAWFINGEGTVMVLGENGNLYVGESVNDDTPTMILNDVVDVVMERDVYGHAEYCAALHTNGNISLVREYYSKIEVYNEVITNASEIYDTSYDECIYKNDKDELIHYDSGSTSVIADNVAKCCVDENFWGDSISYFVDANGDLKEIKTKKYVMSNVNDIISFEYSGKGARSQYIYLVLKSNGDLYMIDSENNDPPERIGRNVQFLSNVKVTVHHYGYNQDHYCVIDYIDSAGGFYVYNSMQKTIDKYYDYVKEMHYLYRNGGYKPQRYVVGFDNNLYWCGDIESIPFSEKVLVLEGVEGLYSNFKDLLAYTNANEIINPDGMVVYLTDVKKVIENTISFYNDYNYYMFIKTNGELWASNSLQDVPFMTKFSEKPTKMYINGDNVTLVSGIQIVNNRSMYPFRECLENMGATVFWDSVNRCAIGEYGEVTVEFPIDANYYYINGEIHYMDTTSYISNGRTYIPIRFAAEALGFKVEWESTPNENVISISNN